ncbi:unnamed protein product [Ilex paraguariensis]|uniref:Uncharacterized protein n=1 Tax=Ilex paraguariensis TaxID=185542 RepID=A0ABC8S6T2_9AQUA
MGNIICCYSLGPQPRAAKLIDVHGNLRLIKVPITVAELMLEEPGHVISPVEVLRRTSRFEAMKADEELSSGKLYMLVPANRIHCLLSESEMALVKFSCEKKKAKRRSSKILPALTQEGGEKGEGSNDPVPVLGGENSGLPCYRLRQWRPALEPISEGA